MLWLEDVQSITVIHERDAWDTDLGRAGRELGGFHGGTSTEDELEFSRQKKKKNKMKIVLDLGNSMWEDLKRR